MLILLFVIGLLILGIGIYGGVNQRYYSYEERKGIIKKFKNACNEGGLHCYFNFIGTTIVIISFIAVLIVGSIYSNHMIIDDKIELYQTENSTIENNIADIVESYKDYEQNTFEKCKTNPTIALEIYPELKSNELVNKQIEVYVKNNKKIKKLKEEKLDYKVLAWWLYFG